MNVYFAPMEGITGYIFRNAYQKFYGNIDKYFAPFMSPADRCPMNPKERRDVIPENNTGLFLVPQILTCKSKHFIEAAAELSLLGYKEINLNLGCPSGTVCAKGKGAGFLSDTDKLDAFLEDIFDFSINNHIDISIKTRLGVHDPEEFYELLDVYNKYPIKEIIIHPRIRSDFYKGEPRIEYITYAVKNSRNKLVYNGDIFTLDKFIEISSKEGVSNIIDFMLGRGLLYNPELCEHIKSYSPTSLQGYNTSNQFDNERFKLFHDYVYREYQKIMSPDINVLYKMKELWTYWRVLFPDSDKVIKKLLKAKKYVEYESCIRQLFV